MKPEVITGLRTERITAMMNEMDIQNTNNGTIAVRQRYNRIAPVYDLCEWMMEYRVRAWRRDLWGRVIGQRILGIGTGTGKNISFYPHGRDITAIDFSEKMLERARTKARRLRAKIDFRLADVQHLPYPNNSFDVAVATFVFCSVPDPLQGLRELCRVLKPGGQLLLLEHVISSAFPVQPLMKILDPVPVHVWGAHIDRETVRNVRMSGFADVREGPLLLDVVKRIEVKVPAE